jgi:hypothetical protein
VKHFSTASVFVYLMAASEFGFAQQSQQQQQPQAPPPTPGITQVIQPPPAPPPPPELPQQDENTFSIEPDVFILRGHQFLIAGRRTPIRARRRAW